MEGERGDFLQHRTPAVVLDGGLLQHHHRIVLDEKMRHVVEDDPVFDAVALGFSAVGNGRVNQLLALVHFKHGDESATRSIQRGEIVDDDGAQDQWGGGGDESQVEKLAESEGSARVRVGRAGKGGDSERIFA